MSLQTLSSLLWNQRQLLELLVFKLEEEQLLLVAGKARWLPRASAEIEAALTQLRDTELARAIESSAVCAELGIATESTLRELAQNAPDQWKDILTAHHTALLQLMSEVEQLTSSNFELLSTAQRAVQEALLHLDESAGTYTAVGTTAHSDSAPRILDQEL